MKKTTQQQSPPQPPAKTERLRIVKRERLPANPSRDFTARSSGSSSCYSSSSNGGGGGCSSGSTSGQRLLLSHSFSSSSSSLGDKPVRLVVSNKPLVRKKPKYLEEKKSKLKSNVKPQRKFTMKPDKVSIFKKQSSVSRDVKVKDRRVSIRVDDSIAQSVTPVSKLGTGSDDGRLSSKSDSSYKERTPPVQASVSPEIQCGSSMSFSASVQSQACYAAGHLLSGVSDKRKCKPKGILTVGENGFEVGKVKILSEFDEGDFGNSGSCNDILPENASVHWLLSPCDEAKEDEKECFSHETLSPLSDRSTSSDLCNMSSDRSLSPMDMGKDTVRRTSSSLSPNELSRFRRFMQLSSCESPAASALDTTPTREQGYKPSPLSVDTLGSENVIQTPESNSSLDHYFKLSCSQAEFQKKQDFGSDLGSLTTTFQSTGLSPKEPSITSFKFDSLATSSDSIDLSHFQRGLADRSSPVTRDRESKTHVRGSRQITDTEFEGKGRELLPRTVAESISTDGGSGLICSEDSNWMACYKT